MPGWRRSTDRAGLRANSLQTGNFTGNFTFLDIQAPLREQETTVLQSLHGNSLCKLTGKKFRLAGKILIGIREFNLQTPEQGAS
jgi:hypothetical protein